jgi:hypothetical protein
MLKKIGKRWALVSMKDPAKILQWYGSKKPSKSAKSKSEKRVQYFKNKTQYKKDHGTEAPF